MNLPPALRALGYSFFLSHTFFFINHTNRTPMSCTGGSRCLPGCQGRQYGWHQWSPTPGAPPGWGQRSCR